MFRTLQCILILSFLTSHTVFTCVSNKLLLTGQAKNVTGSSRIATEAKQALPESGSSMIRASPIFQSPLDIQEHYDEETDMVFIVNTKQTLKSDTLPDQSHDNLPMVPDELKESSRLAASSGTDVFQSLNDSEDDIKNEIDSISTSSSRSFSDSPKSMRQFRPHEANTFDKKQENPIEMQEFRRFNEKDEKIIKPFSISNNRFINMSEPSTPSSTVSSPFKSIFSSLHPPIEKPSSSSQISTVMQYTAESPWHPETFFNNEFRSDQLKTVKAPNQFSIDSQSAGHDFAVSSNGLLFEKRRTTIYTSPYKRSFSTPNQSENEDPSILYPRLSYKPETAHRDYQSQDPEHGFSYDERSRNSSSSNTNESFWQRFGRHVSNYCVQCSAWINENQQLAMLCGECKNCFGKRQKSPKPPRHTLPSESASRSDHHSSHADIVFDV